MEKFAVDLDKVLDEFELNEDDETVNNRILSYQVNVAPQYSHQFNSLPPKLANGTTTVSSSNEKHISGVSSTAQSQPLENIDLKEADFAPSLNTTSSDLNSSEKINKITIYSSFSDNTINRTSNIHAAAKELLTDANKNHLISPENCLKTTNKTTHSKSDVVDENIFNSNLSNAGLVVNLQTNKSDECKEREPDVVQVYSPTMQRLSTTGGILENGIHDSDSVTALPDVMVISSSVISDTETPEQTETHFLKSNVNNFSNCDLDLGKVAGMMSEQNNEVDCGVKLASTEPCESEKMCKGSEIAELPKTIPNETEISEERDQPNVCESLDDTSKVDAIVKYFSPTNQPNENLVSANITETSLIGFSDEVPIVNEHDVDEYLKCLDSPENSNDTEHTEGESLPKEPCDFPNNLGEPMNEAKNSEADVSMKRAIDEIDGCIYNTGARPKKTLMSFEKGSRCVDSDSREESYRFNVESLSPTTECDQQHSVSRNDVQEHSTPESPVKSESDDGENTPDVITNCKEVEILSSDEFSQNTNSQDSGAISSVANRRQRPTSLNLPRLNLGLPNSQSADNISSTTHSIPSQIPEFLPSRSQNLKDQPSNSVAPRRPSSLCVGTPLNSLVSTVVQPPGHTPGNILRIPDLCDRLEASDSLLDDTTKEENSLSSSSSSQSGCHVSTSPSETPSQNMLANTPPSPNVDSSPVTSTSIEDEQLGRVAPFWMPDSSTSHCMLCESKFTVLKRRHHCRACGKVLCAQCSNLKAKLQFMDYKDGRVCQPCFQVLSKENQNRDASNQGDEVSDNLSSSDGILQPYQGHGPNPNNPSEYCSTIPPLQQVTVDRPPPVVMVPVGVLKREGTKNKGEPKQVIFSDGIRPGGDLTELDATPEPAIPCKRLGRTQKKITGSGNVKSCNVINCKSPVISHESLATMNDESPLQNSGLNILTMDQPQMPDLIETLKDDDIDPVPFAINNNLSVLMKIVNLDCCVNLVCWCFSTRGMCTIGQDEIVIIMQYLPNETDLPLDVFRHLSYIYDEAFKGNVISDMGHSLVTQSFLGSKDHGGFLYIKPTFQCLSKLVVPPAPYLFAILLDKWETPWAKVFPMRLMLRLGAEFRYYPCPVVSTRFRKSVFCEIGHTIMNVLADFRNYQYGLPSVKGMVTQMEDKKTYINFPRNRYDEVMKVLNNSNEHVLALSCNFNMEADSHLVCIQNDEGHYETQAINIQNKARKVTGASFVVFNGALKSSCKLSAKSSIVEDGLMVQISPDTMLALRQSLRDMNDFTIGCGPLDVVEPDEVVLVKWVDDDKNINVGIKSVVDGMELDGIKSIRIHSGTDYMGDTKLIRWTEVFLIQTDEDENSTRTDPINISRLSETLAQACCIALTPHLEQLKESGISKIGLRCSITSEKVEYEVGANGEKLPDFYMNDLDTELVPVIHRAASNSHDDLVVLELVFFILEN